MYSIAIFGIVPTLGAGGRLRLFKTAYPSQTEWYAPIRSKYSTMRA